MVLLVEVLFAVSSVVFAVTALVIAGKALQAYTEEARRAMLFLSVGLSLAAAGMIATLISAFLTDFADPRMLLLVNSVFFTVGFLLVIYSILIYE